jgi:hypothetical protein
MAGGFLSLTGSSAAADLGIGNNPAMPGNMAADEIKKRKKQLEALDQAKYGMPNNVGRMPGQNQGASLSLLGKGY